MSTSTRTGLTSAEAEARLAASGPNVLPHPAGRSLGALVIETVREPMFFLLLAAAGIYLVLGDLGEGLFMLAGAGLTVALVIAQAARSERALAALRDLAEPFATVIRDATQRRIPARDLVTGDILLVSEGERLPADVRFRTGEPIEVDESVLTGESAPVLKTPRPSAEANAPADLFAGTVVTRGNGLGEVHATGAATAFGRIGASLAVMTEAATPLQKSARRLTGVLGVVALVVCLLTALAYGVFRGDWVDGALSGLTLSIALIPEEFPMVLTVFMALGAWRLARRQVLVRRSAAIEALGAASVLCVDKTGTLTENRMQLARLWTEAGGPGADLLEAGALASDETSSDPMDRAILAEQRSTRPEFVPGRCWPLSAERLAVVRLWTDGGQTIASAREPRKPSSAFAASKVIVWPSSGPSSTGSRPMAFGFWRRRRGGALTRRSHRTPFRSSSGVSSASPTRSVRAYRPRWRKPGLRAWRSSWSPGTIRPPPWPLPGRRESMRRPSSPGPTLWR